MPIPTRHRRLAEMLGSWPYAPLPNLTTPQLVPGSIEPRATILGRRVEPAAGYAVGGYAFTLWRDVAGVPTAVAVTLTAGNKTLAQVVAEINATVGITPDVIASEDNGFLRLTSPTAGAASYLRLATVSGSEEFFNEMGLVSETVAVGGEPIQAQHIDPSREVATPGQLALSVGEPFSAARVNRLSMGLAQNMDRLEGLLDLRPIAVKVEETFAGSGATNVRLNTANPTEKVFVGGTTTPTVDQLEDVLVVLDANGDEFTQEYQETLDAGLTDLDFAADADTGETICTSPTANFAATDVAENVYVLVTNFATAVALNNIPLKVIRYIDANNVSVQAIVPSTGLRLTPIESARSGSRIRIHNVKAAVDGLYSDAGLTTRVENVGAARTSATGSVVRVQRNNQVVLAYPTVDFAIDCAPGDVVTWTGASSTDPWTNNGTYRIARVIDAQTLELVDDNFGPVYLNPNVAGGYGSIAVTTDPLFREQPYARFAQPTAPNLAAGIGAVPASGDSFRVVYQVGRSVRAAVEADPSVLANSPRYDQEATAEVKRALMRLAGPSVTAFDQVLQGSFEVSVENLQYRLDREHYESGRHRYIRPDVVDMFPGVAGRTVAVRAAAADASGVAKAEVLSSAGTSLLRLTAAGSLEIGTGARFDVTSSIDVSTAGFQTRAYRALGTNYETVSSNFASVLSNPEQTVLPALQSIWEWDDGVIADPVQFAWALTYGTASPYSAGSPYVGYKLNINNNGAGVRLDNVWVVEPDGAMGWNLGALGTASRPTAPYHFRARSTSDLELLRLEGASDLQQTLAIGFKPQLTNSLFSFIEVDVDASTWFMNFALTSAAGTASAGGTEAFRFITEAAGVGLGTEVLRVHNDAASALVDAGRTLVTSAAEAAVPRFGALLTSFPNVPFRFRGSSVAYPGFSLNTNGTDVDMSFGAYRDSLGTWLFDVGSPTPSATHLGRLRIRNGAGGFFSLEYLDTTLFGSQPVADGSWTPYFRVNLPTGGESTVYAGLTNGALQMLSAPASGGTNPSFDSANTRINTLYAKNITKAWCIVEVDTGASLTDTHSGGTPVSLIDGFNVADVELTANNQLVFTFVNDFATTVYAGKGAGANGNVGVGYGYLVIPTTTATSTMFIVDAAGGAINLTTIGAGFPERFFVTWEGVQT